MRNKKLIPVGDIKVGTKFKTPELSHVRGMRGNIGWLRGTIIRQLFSGDCLAKVYSKKAKCTFCIKVSNDNLYFIK